MNRFATIAAASLASLASATASHAIWVPFATAPGALRPIASANQTSTGASNATSYLAVQRCTGVMQYPAWVVTGPNTCVATAADYQITMDVLSPTQTKVTILATGAACGIKTVQFGTPNSQCGYDIANPSPGTAGSNTGANPVPIAGGSVGLWNVQVKLDNACYYPGTVVQMDLYSRMTVYFSSCFDAGDMVQFTIDTDKIS